MSVDTALQPSLFGPALGPIVPVSERAEESLDEYFKRWLEANPHVLDAFVHYAVQLRRSGVDHFGAKAIVEHMRFETALQTQDENGFKLDNNMTSRLARAAVARRPELAEMFEFRSLRS